MNPLSLAEAIPGRLGYQVLPRQLGVEAFTDILPSPSSTGSRLFEPVETLALRNWLLTLVDTSHQMSHQFHACPARTTNGCYQPNDTTQCVAYALSFCTKAAKAVGVAMKARLILPNLHPYRL